jgi:hypothetical protein
LPRKVGPGRNILGKAATGLEVEPVAELGGEHPRIVVVEAALDGSIAASGPSQKNGIRKMEIPRRIWN